MGVAIKKVEGGRITLSSPYHPDLPAKAKRLGGRFEPVTRAWVFDARDEERVRAMARSVYGTDGADEAAADLVDIRLANVRTRTVPEYEHGILRKDENGEAISHTERDTIEAHTGGVYFAGRCLAAATGRDTGARLSTGVVVASGPMPRSGGSAKNWHTIIPVGCVLEVRDVPRAALPTPEDAAADGWAYEILTDQPKVDVDALNAERARLQARLAEIDGLLGEASQEAAEAILAQCAAEREEEQEAEVAA